MPDFADFRAIEHQRGGIVPAARIAVCRRQRQHDFGARRAIDPRDRAVLARQPRGHFGRSLQPQHFLDQRGNELRIGAQPVLKSGLVGDEAQRIAEQLGAGALPGCEQERRQSHDFHRIGQRAIGVGRVRQIRQHIVLRIGAAIGDILRKIHAHQDQRRILLRKVVGIETARAHARVDRFHKQLAIILRHAEQVGYHVGDIRRHHFAHHVAMPFRQVILHRLIGVTGAPM